MSEPLKLKWTELVGGIGPTRPVVYATARARRRKPKAKAAVAARDTPPVPAITSLLAAIGRWARLSCWWLYAARALALIFPETARFCRPRGRTYQYGFA